MREWIGVAGVVGVAAFTPGPNNFIVMRIAAYSGLGAAIPAIAAVVVGSLAMLTLANAGAGVALQTMPQWRLVLTAAGAASTCACWVCGSCAAATSQAPWNRPAFPVCWAFSF